MLLLWLLQFYWYSLMRLFLNTYLAYKFFWFYEASLLIHGSEESEKMADSISFHKSLGNIFNNLPIKVELLKYHVAFDRTQDSFPFAHIATVFNDPVDNVIKKRLFSLCKCKVATWQFLSAGSGIKVSWG